MVVNSGVNHHAHQVYSAVNPVEPGKEHGGSGKQRPGGGGGRLAVVHMVVYCVSSTVNVPVMPFRA
jgi:hypothetical protein